MKYLENMTKYYGFMVDLVKISVLTYEGSV